MVYYYIKWKNYLTHRVSERLNGKTSNGYINMLALNVQQFRAAIIMIIVSMI